MKELGEKRFLIIIVVLLILILSGLVTQALIGQVDTNKVYAFKNAPVIHNYNENKPFGQKELEEFIDSLFSDGKTTISKEELEEALQKFDGEKTVTSQEELEKFTNKAYELFNNDKTTISKEELEQITQYVFESSNTTNDQDNSPKKDEFDKNILIGAVKIWRKLSNGTDIKLVYKEQEEFNKLVETGNSEMFTCFTINDNWEIIVAKYKKTTIKQSAQRGSDGNIVSESYEYYTETLRYKEQVAKYSMPFEFLFAHLVITENPEYVAAIADLVLTQTEIRFTIMDSVSTDTTEDEYEYSETTTVTDEEGNISTSTYNHYEKQTTIVKINNITAAITHVKTWIYEKGYDENGEIEELYILEYSPKSVISESEVTEPDKTISSTPSRTVTRTNIKRTHKESAENSRWESTVKATERINTDRFLGLWKNAEGEYKRGALYDPNGEEVSYDIPDSTKKEIPVTNITKSPELFFDFLESSSRTEAHEMLMKYILWIYTGEDYGYTDANIQDLLDIFKSKSFTGFGATGLAAYLRQFSHDVDADGNIDAPKSTDGNYYQMFDDTRGWPTIGNADIQWASHAKRFNLPGKVFIGGTEQTVSSVRDYVNGLIGGSGARYVSSSILAGIYIDVELVDQIGNEMQKEYYDSVVNATVGLNLSQQQLYPLTAITYNFGHLPVRNGYTFKQVYEAGAKLYEINSWEHNRFIWDNWWSKIGGGSEGHIPARDAAFETYVKGIFNFFHESGAGAVFRRSHYIYYTQVQVNSFGYAPNKPITRNSSNEQEIFTYVENSNAFFGGEGSLSRATISVNRYKSTSRCGRLYQWLYWKDIHTI